MKNWITIFTVFSVLLFSNSLLFAANPFEEANEVNQLKKGESAQSQSSSVQFQTSVGTNKELQNHLGSQKKSESVARLQKFYRPTGEWTGRLIFPGAKQRENDGSVLIEIHNSPVAALIGKVCRLRWDSSSPRGDWYESIRPDVNITAETIKTAREAGSLIPVRLNGLKRVSALESLAGGRYRDDVEVLLVEPRYEGGSIYIDTDPVQIVGNQKALIRFVGSETGGFRDVEHFDPATGDFNSKNRELVRCYEHTGSVDNLRPTTRHAELLALNKQGYYVYGRRIDGVFQIEALEPRELVSFKASGNYQGKSSVERYLREVHFSHLRPGIGRTNFANPADGKSPFAGAAPEKVFVPGKRYPLIHLFGWQDTGEKKSFPASVGLNPGHFSYGSAELVVDDISGEYRWDITYRRVYAHNREAILAGAQKWHAYMGSLRRGWMYSIPVWDTIVSVPEMQPYQIGSWERDPMDGFWKQLDRMNAVYRTGAGTGLCSVRPDVSCVQDSNCALYTSLKVFEDLVAGDSNLKDALAQAGEESAEVKRFSQLQTLVNEIEKVLTGAGVVRWDWKQADKDLLSTRQASQAQSIIRALQSPNTIFPRDAQDKMLRLAKERGYPIWAIISSQIGGYIPGIKPVKPTSIIGH